MFSNRVNKWQIIDLWDRSHRPRQSVSERKLSEPEWLFFSCKYQIEPSQNKKDTTYGSHRTNKIPTISTI
jgi:hypothetical protein